MKYTIKRKDIAGETVELIQAPFSGRVVAQAGGVSLERVSEKFAPFLVKMKDGSTKKLTVRARLLDPVPTVYLDEEEILLARHLHIVECIFAALPILMFLIHGALATLLAFFLLLANFRILRSSMNPTVRWCAIYALNIVVYWIFAFFIKLIFQGVKT